MITKRSPDDLLTRKAVDECIGKMIKEYREMGEDGLADGMILARRYGISKLEPVSIEELKRRLNYES